MFRAMLICLAVLIATSQSLWAGMKEDCIQGADPGLSINGCTAMIGSGKYSAKNLAKVYSNRGIAYSDLGENNRAISDYDQAIRLSPGYASAYYNRGTSYGRLGELKRAISDYDQAIRLDPRDADAYHNRAVSYKKLGQNDKANRSYDQAYRLYGKREVKAYQKKLKKHGYYTGALDGIWGRGTRAASEQCTAAPNC